MHNFEQGGSADGSEQQQKQEWPPQQDYQQQQQWPSEPSGSEEYRPVPFNCLELNRKLQIRPAWMDDWDVTCSAPPGLEVLGPKTEAQVKAEEEKRLQAEAERKSAAAIEKDFRTIYGYTKESMLKRKKADDEEEHWENFSSWNFGIFTLFPP